MFMCAYGLAEFTLIATCIQPPVLTSFDKHKLQHEKVSVSQSTATIMHMQEAR